ncbi:MAG: choice-of-anchor K domain-containing protein [Candidatus Dojkabacteria bacterium]
MSIHSIFGDTDGEITKVAAADGPYTLSSTSGIWTSVTGGPGLTHSPLNTNEIRWGNPVNTGKRSGLRFDGKGVTNFNANETFLIGDFTHFNWATYSGTSANGATLKVTLNFSNPVITPSPTFSYNFDIEETRNYSRLSSCDYYGTDNQISNTPCDDIITFPNGGYGEEVYTIGDMKYTLKIDGFKKSYPNGTTLSKFVTEEEKNNVAYLVGRLSSVLVEKPAISIEKYVAAVVEGQADVWHDADTAPGIYVGEGDQIKFKYDVQNTGNVKLTNITVTDDKGVSLSCPATELEAGAKMTCNSVGTHTAILGLYTNTGTVVGTHTGGTVTANDKANYTGVKKIRICHATDSHQNPYNNAQASMTGDVQGHDSHHGNNPPRVWYPGIQGKWDDIIPPFTYYGGTYPGKNWDAYGQSVYNNNCTIPTGTLKVNKVTIPTGDSAQFGITGSGTPSVTGAPTFLNSSTGTISSNSSHTFTVYPGTYSVQENTLPDGWLMKENTCNNIAVAKGENKECTITNTKYGSLTIVKDATPSSNQEFTFTTTGDGLSGFTLIDNSDTSNPSKEFKNLKAGTYSVAETVPSDWKLTSATCSDGSPVSAINLSVGENITCTFNNVQYGSIFGHKWVDADGLADTTNDRTPVSGWTIFIDANGNGVWDEGEEKTTTGTDGKYSFINLLPGTYKVVEQMETGWIVLVGDSKVVELSAGENEEVNFVNVKLGSITVKKNVDSNGDGDLDDDVDVIGSDQWNWTLNNVTVGKTGTTKNKLEPGTYTINETDGPAHYHFVSLTCTGAADNRITITGDTAKINLESGEDVVCTYRNARNLGKLIIEKEVINDNGGSKKATDFSFKIGSENPIQFTQNGDDVLKGRNEYTRYAGLSYTVTEPEADSDGYTTTYNNCTNIVVPHGGQAVCKITNNDNKPSLTLVKEVNNDNGGTLSKTDWTLTATGPTTISGDGGATSGDNFKAGTYTLSEIGKTGVDVSGYEAGKWSCTNNIVVNENNQITLGLNQSTVCKIVNDDKAPSLELIKEVNNKFGGNAKATDWTLTATGPTTISGDGGVTSGNDFKVGTYTLSESGNVTGYSASDWSCTNNIAVNENNQITLGLGQSTKCTITNSDIQPTLKLVKTVANNHGGDKKVADFNLYIGNTKVDSGVATGVNANTEYTVSEDQLPGYSASVWGGDCSAEGKITLLPGDNKTCTITNSDIAPTLKLVKSVTNDNGGKLEAKDWTLTAKAGTEEFSNLGDAGTVHTVKAGVGYVLSESTVAGYASEGWKCDKGTLDGNTITLGLAENATCTITNNDIAPKLTLNKIVLNKYGGNKVESDWTLYAKQGEVVALSGKGAEGDNDVVSGETFQAGSYTLSEKGVLGYDASDWSCTGTGSLKGNVITLGIGQEAICSITNTDRPAGLTVIKEVINDNGGKATADDFDIRLNKEKLEFKPWTGGVGQYTFTYASTPKVQSNTKYTLTEIDHPDYKEGEWSCKDNKTGNEITHPFTLVEGQSVTCTITNDDIAPTLKLVKSVTNDNGGTLGPKDWTLSATGPTPISGDGGATSGSNFKAGTYTLGEVGKTGVDVSGYEAGKWSCTNNVTVDENNQITLGLNQSTVCTIVNNDIAPKLTIVKHVDNEGNDGTKKAEDFKIMVDGEKVSEPSFQGSEEGVIVTLNAGEYKVTEEEDTENYTASYSKDCSGTINVGEEKTCTITNTGIDHEPTIEVTKNADKTSVKETGEDVIFTFTVKNTSKVDTVTILSLVDTVFGTLSGNDNCKVGTELAPNATCSFTLTKKISGDYSGPDHYNKFTVEAKDEEGNKTDDSDDQTITFTDEKPSVEVLKTAGVTEIPETGGEVEFTYKVTNTGLEKVTITSLEDDVFGTLTGDDDCKVGIELEAGKSCEFKQTFTIDPTTPGDPNAATSHKNIFTATVEDNEENEAEDSDEEEIKLTPVPSLKLVKKVVHKYNSDETITAADWTLSAKTEDDEGISYAGDTDKFEFVKAGEEYSLSETGEYMSQFEPSAWSCTGGELVGSTLKLAATDDVVCTITNTALPGTIKIYKDVVYGDTDIYSSDEFEVKVDSDTESQKITDTEEDPKVAEFTNLDAGEYNPEEINVPNGYRALGCYPREEDQDYTVGNGETLEFVCLNEVIEPLLEIEKENDAATAKYAGDQVTYTITVTAPEDEDNESKYLLNNVEVFDLAPAGFDYNSGTWSAISSVRGDITGITTVEPTYNGTDYAKWTLGNMEEGEIVILKYTTTISLTQDPGTYPDIAWVKGVSLANSNVLGNVSTGADTPFVGTKVQVIAPDEIEEGEVLGASTIVRLPSTGASTYLTLGGLITMLVGLLIAMFGSKKQRKSSLKLSLLTAVASLLFLPFYVHAAEYLDVKIEQPKTPTNISKFEIGFVAMSTSPEAVKVECFEEGKPTPFQTVNASTGNCLVDVKASGTYKYYVKATVGGEEKDSDTVEVTVNLEKPQAVLDYSKTGNTLSFKTANDGITKHVQIFRSEKVSFTANASTLVHSMTVLPNTTYTWTDGSAESGKTYYYALRAVDAYGNLSPIISDNEVITVVEKAGTTTTQTGQVAGAISMTTSGTTAKDTTGLEDAEVKGDTDTTGEETENTDVEKSDAETQESEDTAEEESKKVSIFKKYWYLWIAGLLVLVGGIYKYVKRER